MSYYTGDDKALQWLLEVNRFNTVLEVVERNLRAYHDVLPRTRLQGVGLEETFANGFAKAKVQHLWTPQSHRKGADIDIRRWGVCRGNISMKSGSRTTFQGRPGGLKFSGGRHGAHGNDLVAMHTAILENAPSLYIMAANPLGTADKYAHVEAYSIFAIPGHLINYGSPHDWARAANGTDFEYCKNGVQAIISKATTNQVWTTLDLAALGIQPVRQILITNKKMQAIAKAARGGKALATDAEIEARMRWGALALPASGEMQYCQDELPLIGEEYGSAA